MTEVESQHPARIRARRIETLTEYLKHTDIPENERAEKLVAYSIIHWGVSKQTAKDYALAVMLQFGEDHN